MPRDCVPRIRIWPLRRDYHSGVGGGGRSDWPAHVLANDVSTRIDRKPVREKRSIALVRHKWQLQGYVSASTITAFSEGLGSTLL